MLKGMELEKALENYGLTTPEGYSVMRSLLALYGDKGGRYVVTALCNYLDSDPELTLQSWLELSRLALYGRNPVTLVPMEDQRHSSLEGVIVDRKIKAGLLNERRRGVYIVRSSRDPRRRQGQE